MDEQMEGLRRLYAMLEPKWRYAAETLAELLMFLLLVLTGVLGFVPWLLWQGFRRLANRIRKKVNAHGAAENADK